jgi:ribonuclease T1
MNLSRNAGGGRPGRPMGWFRLVLILVIVAIGFYLSRRDDSAAQNDKAPPESRPTEVALPPAASDIVAVEPVPETEPPTRTEDRQAAPRRTTPDTSAAASAESTRTKSSPAATAPENATPAAEPSVIANQRIYDLDRKLVYEGDIDVGPTLARIEAGQRLRFPNDGATFQNRERRLPRQPAGYYREYVHPTEELLPSPGPQRIVIGEAGETYYTPDHYRTFRRLDE